MPKTARDTRITAVLFALIAGVLIEGGYADAVEVMEQTFREPFAAVSFLAGILYYVGIVLTGVAVWRSEILWRWGGLLYMVSGVVGIPAFLATYL